MTSDSTVILAVNNFGLLWMQLKSTFPEPLMQTIQQESSLPLGATVKQSIIGIPTPFNGRKVPTDPSVKSVVQKEIGQYRADNAASCRALHKPPCGVPTFRPLWLPSRVCIGAVSQRFTCISTQDSEQWRSRP